MDNIIIGMLNALGAGPEGSFEALAQSPEQYNSTLYAAAETLHNVAVKPLTAVVLTIVLLLMLAAQSTRVDGDRELGVRVISGILLKAALVIVFASNAMTILKGIDEAFTAVAAAALDADVGTGDIGELGLGDQLADDVKDAGTVDKLGVFVLALLPFIVTKIAGVLALVLIYVRFLQLYLLTVFASLPIAFLSYEETKPMGITYLKRYASTALTGVVLLLAVKMYQAMLGNLTTVSIDGDTNLSSVILLNFGSFFVAPLVLIFILFGASQIAKSVVGDA